LSPEEQASPPSPVFPAEELIVEEAPLPIEAVPLSIGEVPLPVEQAPLLKEPLPVERHSLAVEEYVPSVVVDPAQITVHRHLPSPSGTRTPPPETPLPVLLLVDQAQNASGPERQELSRRINRWLDQMVLEGGSRHVADWFHHLIESGRLEGLADAAGHSCHETAVRGLLSMGFPYALEVRPEDLERIKPREDRRRSRKRDKALKGVAAGIVAGGAIVELVRDLIRDNRLTGIVTVEVGVALLATVVLLFSKPRTPMRNMGLAVLLVTSLLSISLAGLGGYVGLATGLAGLVATLLFALHRS
jgi:hypothetical protein